MAKAPRIPSTPALRLLKQQGVPHTVVTYAYVERGGAQASAAALQRDLHTIVKTLVFEDADGAPLIVLMHGDQSVSAKALARALDTKLVRPCDPAVAERHSGYKVGGTSPFGTRRTMPVYVQRTILDLPRITINAGARGVLMDLDPQVLLTTLQATPVDVAR